jgi:hypothetical protein
MLMKRKGVIENEAHSLQPTVKAKLPLDLSALGGELVPVLRSERGTAAERDPSPNMRAQDDHVGRRMTATITNRKSPITHESMGQSINEPMIQSAHTPPQRLSAVRGGKMNQLTESEVRQSQITNRKSPMPQWPNESMNQ